MADAKASNMQAARNGKPLQLVTVLALRTTTLHPEVTPKKDPRQVPAPVVKVFLLPNTLGCSGNLQGHSLHFSRQQHVLDTPEAA